MAALAFPSIVPDVSTFGVTYNTQVSTSDISGVMQTVELPGARWSGSITFTDMTPTEAAELKAFLLKLRGASGTFFYGDLSHTQPFNTITGGITILSPSTSRVVRVDTATGLFSVGDYIQIGVDDARELKMIVAVSDLGSGVQDLTIEPMLRRTDFIGLDAIYTNPKGTFMLSSDDQANWAIRSKALLSDINIDFVEVF